MNHQEVAALRPERFLVRAVAVTLLLGCVWLSAAQEPQTTEADKTAQKLVPPSPIDQADYEKIIRNLPDLAKDFAAVKQNRAAAGALAAKLAELATNTKSPGGRYVALRLALELAIQAGDVSRAMTVIDQIDRAYRLNADSLRFDTLKAVGPNTTGTGNRTMVYEALALVSNPNLSAQALFDLAASAAAKTKHAGLIQRVQSARQLYQQVPTDAGPYQQARAVLTKNPNDKAANLVVGKHLCLKMGHWDAGLRHLLRSDHFGYRLLARNDLKRPPDADSQRELGDDWWDLAQTETDGRSALRYRAGYWYQRALPGLKGTAAAVVQKRLEEIDQPNVVVVKVPEEKPEVLDAKQYLDIQFHEGDPKLKTPTMRFGLTLPEQAVPGNPNEKKRLTYDPFGLSNNTCLKIEGIEQLLGSNSGHWQVRKESLGRDRIGVRSVWLTDDLPIRVTQTVELVRGAQTRKLDTCKVLYTIENTSKKKEYLVGLRFLLDTFIGTNDGAPFILPGEATICETQRDLKGERVPAFVQSLEDLGRLRAPGTVASINLKLGGVEAPTRVTLGAWPNPDSMVPGANGPLTLWDVPLFSMKKLMPADSAVTMYWNEKPLAPGAKRLLGFSYGLGNFAASKDGTLGVIVGGELHEGGTLHVVGLVGRPEKGQKTTLHVSDGLEIVGNATQVVAQPPGGADNPYTPVTWKVKAKRKGLMDLRVVSNGSTASQEIRLLEKPVTPPAPVDVEALLEADLKKLQGTWYVVASQPNGKKPAPMKVVVVGQTLTLYYDPKTSKEGSESCFFKVDPIANPKKIDVFPPIPGFQQPGIVRWQNEQLEVCLGERIKVAVDGKIVANAESVRPRTFDAKTASLWRLSRTKPGLNK